MDTREETNRLLGEIAAELRRGNEIAESQDKIGRERYARWLEHETQSRDYYARSLALSEQNRDDSRHYREEWRQNQQKAVKVLWGMLAFVLLILIVANRPNFH